MKNALLFALLLATGPALAQTTSTEPDGAYSSLSDQHYVKGAPALGKEAKEPFRGANTIIIHSSDSASTAFRAAGRALINSGYSPTQKDAELLYLLTAYRQLDNNSNLRLAVRVSVQREGVGSAISFTGTFASAMADMWVRGATPLTARAQYKPGNLLRAWNEVMRVAASCNCGQFAYAVRP